MLPSGTQSPCHHAHDRFHARDPTAVSGALFHEQEDALVEAVTHEDIIRVACRVLEPQRVVVAVIRPE